MIEAPPQEQARVLLRAGALLPVSWVAPEHESTTGVATRTYRDRSLGDRVVVRLVPDGLEAAEDATAAAVGLQVESSGPVVARARPRPIGFGTWLILHRTGLRDRLGNAVTEIDRLGRLAQSKPGAARTGYEDLARRLTSIEPALVPRLYDDAGRRFIEAGHATQAAALFGKARDAERHFSLNVDRTEQDAKFMEFAVAGALSGRVLEDYALQLAHSDPPLEAYATFRAVCLERTRAGMPPWGSMGTRLQSLARAAGLDQDQAAEELLLELLPCAAIERASVGFWKTYRKPLLSLAHQSAAVRGRLLNLMPVPARDTGDFADWHLRLLDASGALDALIEPTESVPEEARPDGTPAGWLNRFLHTVVRRSLKWSPAPASLHALLVRMADRLREQEGESLDLFGRASSGADLQLVEHALALGLDVEAPGDQRPILHHWFQSGAPGTLTHAAAHPVLGPMLEHAVDEYIRASHADALIDSVGFRPLLEGWLEWTCDQVAEGCLGEVDAALDALAKATTPRTFASAAARWIDLAKRASAPACGAPWSVGSSTSSAGPLWKKPFGNFRQLARRGGLVSAWRRPGRTWSRSIRAAPLSSAPTASCSSTTFGRRRLRRVMSAGPVSCTREANCCAVGGWRAGCGRTGATIQPSTSIQWSRRRALASD